MAEDQTKSLKIIDSGGVTRQVTYVTTKRFEVDEKGLRKALTAKVFDRYTVRKLDRPALEKAMDHGEVDPMLVAKFVSEKESAAYLRYSEKEETDG